MSLDPPLSDAELLRRAKERGAVIDSLPSDEELLARAARQKQRGLTGREEERLDSLAIAAAPIIVRLRRQRRGEVTLAHLTTSLKKGEVIAIDGVIYGAARTKKNHKQNVATQSEAYKHWRNGIVAAFRIPRKPVLPAQPLNLCAEFFVDSRGKRADLLGLLQGFADALQDAGVVTDDIWIEGFDGSRKRTFDPGNPRVVFSLHPLEEKYD